MKSLIMIIKSSIKNGNGIGQLENITKEDWSNLEYLHKNRYINCSGPFENVPTMTEVEPGPNYHLL